MACREEIGRSAVLIEHLFAEGGCPRCTIARHRRERHIERRNVKRTAATMVPGVKGLSIDILNSK